MKNGFKHEKAMLPKGEECGQCSNYSLCYRKYKQAKDAVVCVCSPHRFSDATKEVCSTCGRKISENEGLISQAAAELLRSFIAHAKLQPDESYSDFIDRAITDLTDKEATDVKKNV